MDIEIDFFFDDDDEDDYYDEEQDVDYEKSSCLSSLGCTGILVLTSILFLIIGIFLPNGWMIAASIIVLLGIIAVKTRILSVCERSLSRNNQHDEDDYDDESKVEYHRGYFRFKDSKKYVHRWVAEKYVVKRKLRFNEVVHHINGDKTDNRPENLQVMSRRDHWFEHHGD